MTSSGEETPLATLRRAWERASDEEREQFLAEIVDRLKQPQRQRDRGLARYLYPTPLRK
jgi:hypothetical protein